MGNSISILTSRVTRENVPIPGTTDTVTFRKLSPKQLQQASVEQFKAGQATLRDVFGDEAVREMRAKAEAEAKAAKEKKPEPEPEDEKPTDPLAGFDRAVLMHKAVLVWSVPDAPLTLETFEDVDDDTSTWLATEILKLSKPALFQSKAEREADKVKG